MNKGKNTFLQQYFWDIDLNNFSPKKYPKFTLERILETGDSKAIKWAKENFSSQLFKKTIINSRCLSPRSANYWGLIFNIDLKKIRCLKKQSLKTQKAAWSH